MFVIFNQLDPAILAAISGLLLAFVLSIFQLGLNFLRGKNL